MVNLVLCILSDAAGIEEDGIGLFFFLTHVVACHLHDAGYNFAVCHIHLAAISFNIKFAAIIVAGEIIIHFYLFFGLKSKNVFAVWYKIITFVQNYENQSSDTNNLCGK